MVPLALTSLLFFFNATATTEIYTLSLHDALPIWSGGLLELALERSRFVPQCDDVVTIVTQRCLVDRKSTRLNSSHVAISYAVFCLKKKKDADIKRRVSHRLPD